MKRALGLGILLAAMCGAASAAGEESWLPSTGPFGGTVRSLVETKAGVLYASTLAYVYTSRDRGANWARMSVNPGSALLAVAPDGALYAANGKGFFMAELADMWRPMKASGYPKAESEDSFPGIEALAAAPDGAILLVTDTNGILKSTNRGASWKAWGTENTRRINVYKGITLLLGTGGWNIVVAPDGMMYSGSRGLIRTSADKGTTWTTPANKGMTPGDVQVLALSSQGVLYAGVSSSRFLKSADKGATWTEANARLQGTMITGALFSRDGVLYVGTSDRGFFKCADNGASCQATGKGAERSALTPLLAAGDGAIYATTDAGLFKSVDKGLT